MTDSKTMLDGTQIEAEQLDDWSPLLGQLTASFDTGDFATGLQLVQRIAGAAEEANHHPDLELTYPAVTVRLTSHDVGGITSRDVELAREISAFAADLGAAAKLAGLARPELGLDTHDAEEIRPFWAAVLAMESDEGGDLVDPRGQVPTIWFQTAKEPSGAPDQRWHLDVRVPPAQVQPRIDAAVAAGGSVVADDEAPSFWVLADPQGNRVCLTTWQGRTHA